MKPTLATLCSIALALSAFAQDPTLTPAIATPPPVQVQPTVPPASVPPAAATVVATPFLAPSVSRASATPDDNSLEQKIENKVKKHLQINFGDDEEKHSKHREHNSDNDADAAFMAIPIIGIIFSTLFGAPVLVVGLIMFFSYWKARSLHRTVRMMVEKGQPVPEALFATPHSPARARSDMRRGVVLMMVGIGVMVFLGAVNDWEDGAWALGVIPFLIGAGYLLVWKLEGPKPTLRNTSTDNLPRVP